MFKISLCLYYFFIMHEEGSEPNGFSEKEISNNTKEDLNQSDYLDASSSQNSSVNRIDGIRVLLAEDYLMNQRLITMMLESNGASVDIANDGKEAFQMAKHSAYDIILMDLNMPNINGIQAAKMIKMFSIETPIVCLTADVNDEIVENILTSGMKEIISKPCQVDDLLKVISKYI